jgi:glutaredoxin
VVDKNFSDVQRVTIYTKDKCNYCSLSKMLCRQNNLNYNEINLTDNQPEIEKTKVFLKETYNADFKTFPQIIVEYKDREPAYIGGYSEFEEYTRPIFDFEKLRDITKVATNNLDKVIDLNYYPVPETKLSNTRHRPLGLGVQGSI